MSVIDYTYFEEGALRIEGVNNGMTCASQATGGAISAYIAEYELDYLCRTLGDALAEELIEYTDNGGEDNEELNALRDNLCNFGGIEKHSPIANYVFFHFLRLAAHNATALGVTINSTDNRIVSTDWLCCRAWNDMVRMNRKLRAYLRSNFSGRYAFDCDMLETLNVVGV